MRVDSRPLRPRADSLRRSGGGSRPRPNACRNDARSRRARPAPRPGGHGSAARIFLDSAPLANLESLPDCSATLPQKAQPFAETGPRKPLEGGIDLVVSAVTGQVMSDGDRGQVLEIDLKEVVSGVVALPDFCGIPEPPVAPRDGKRVEVKDLAIIHGKSPYRMILQGDMMPSRVPCDKRDLLLSAEERRSRAREPAL